MARSITGVQRGGAKRTAPAKKSRASIEPAFGRCAAARGRPTCAAMWHDVLLAWFGFVRDWHYLGVFLLMAV
ncbi:MAG TPA: hypothetical protein VK348_03205, partial [Planctomycetota bacterium]|nr:hypothetical protein [Planctomycetota bacterium]